MEQRKKRVRKASATKIIPPKKKQTQSLSRDEVRSINKNKLKRKRKIKKLIALVALALVIISISVILVLTVFFKINKISVSGPDIYPDKKVIEQSNIELGSSLFGVDEEEVNQVLTKRLPYIKSVKITRKLPATLNIEVVATKEAAAINYGEAYVVVDETGKVLNKSATQIKEDVAIVNGMKVKSCNEGEIISFNSKEATDNFILFISLLREKGLNNITEIICVKADEFKAIYDGRITIKFGSMDNLEVKTERAKKALEHRDSLNQVEVGVLDLSFDDDCHFHQGEEEELTIAPEIVTDENGNVLFDSNGEVVTHPSTTATEVSEEE